MSAGKLREAVELFRTAVRKDDLRGAVLLVARRGKIVLHEAVGWRDKEASLPMERDTLFRMASNTKAVIATAVLMLAEDGKIDLDAEVGRYLPAFDSPKCRGMKVRHLLSHTSGLRIPGLFVEPLMAKSAEHPDAPSLRLEVDRIGQVGPKVKPGTSYQYSNAGYNTLGALVEVCSGKPLEAFLAERIYGPLGMRETSNHPSADKTPRMAVVYRRTRGRWQILYHTDSPEKAPFVRASGGMISSAVDYARFCQTWLDGGVRGGKRLLSADLAAQATSPQTANLAGPKSPVQQFYGFGWSVADDGVFSHGGSEGTFAWIDPRRQLIGLIFTQSPGGRIPRQEFIAAVNAACIDAPPKLAHALPADVGMDGAKLARIDQIVTDGIRAGEMPGCVVTVGRHGKIVFQKAYGDRQVEPDRAPMTVNTVFDMASLTKPTATATSVMILVEQGKIELDAPVARYLPEFGQNGKEAITVFQLLTHQSGLVPDNALGDYEDGPEKAWQRIYALNPTTAPGTKFVYSDVNFLVLGQLVRRVSGKSVHEFSQERVYRPLGMTETGFLPGEPFRRRAAPTEQRDGHWIKGEVHDPRSYLLGGVAGHAGLFSTADDLAVFAQMMLGRGEYGGVRVLRPATVERMTRAYPVSSGLRGLGWDIKTGYSINRGQSFSSRAFGHGGFTGTVMWIDPELDLFVVFLSNRLHPDGKGTVNPLAGRIGTVVGEAVSSGQGAEGRG